MAGPVVATALVSPAGRGPGTGCRAPGPDGTGPAGSPSISSQDAQRLSGQYRGLSRSTGRDLVPRCSRLSLLFVCSVLSRSLLPLISCHISYPCHITFGLRSFSHLPSAFDILSHPLCDFKLLSHPLFLQYLPFLLFISNFLSNTLSTSSLLSYMLSSLNLSHLSLLQSPVTVRNRS